MQASEHAVCAGDTTAKLVTLAHSDLDYRLYLPLFQLIISQFPCLTEHLTAFTRAQPKHMIYRHIRNNFLLLSNTNKMAKTVYVLSFKHY